MVRPEKVKRIKLMLSQIDSAETIESIPESRLRPDMRAGLEGLEVASDPKVAIESGRRKMVENRENEVTSAELNALEAIVMPMYRPVVFVRGDSYDHLDPPWTELNTESVKTRINPLLPLIGRIEVPNSPLLPYAGTGFVVGRNLLMTNRHVAALFTQGLGSRLLYHAGDAAVDFKRQVDSTEDDRRFYLNVLGVEMIHPFWDMALLRVDGLLTNRVLNLSVRLPEDLVGRNIVAVGYPARDDRNDLSLQDQIFNRTYNVKRLQPGKIRQRAEVHSFDNLVNAMAHDSSTLGGNSGSAIIDVDTGDVVALHFAGEYLKANYAVPMYELARDRRVAPKLNFRDTLSPTDAWEGAWQKIEGTKSNTVSHAAPSTADAISAPLQSPSIGAPSGASQALATTWDIPLRVIVSLGQPSVVYDSASAPDRPSNPCLSADEETVVIDHDYTKRPGYDPSFLESVEVPLPSISENMRPHTAVVSGEYRKGSDLFELAYYHYSVYMNKHRRTAWFSAANVDGGHRPAIGKRQGDRWFTDPRISKSEQIGQEAFEHGIDRGHLTRREDTAWGSNVAETLKANNDTFHFTNCSLQASLFNRGKDRWQGLEQFLLEKHAKKEKRRMVVITGPVFAPNDPIYRNENMDYSVRCPVQFWKICVLIREDGTPSATGFVLGQEEIANLPGFEEAFDVAATQVTVADLEARTGLKFGDLKAHDHFAQSHVPGTLELPGEDQRRGKPLRAGSDIVV